MKKTLFALLFVLVGAGSLSAQKKMEAVFDRYADDDRFTYVSVGRGAFNLIRSFTATADLSNEEREIISKMNGVKILTLDRDRNESTVKRIMNDVTKIVRSAKHESIAEVRDKGQRTEIFLARDKSELVIINNDENEMSLIWLHGRN